jgi:two-component system, LytTR family, response regulator
MTRPIRTLVVDDEPLARQRIRDLLTEYPDVQVIGECSDGEEAVEAILAEQPDLVFLDIQMPEMTGLEVVESVGPEAMPAVIFVTAYDEFALRAFDAHAVDYLMKPFHRNRFDAALERARRFVGAGETRAATPSGELESRLHALLTDLRPPSPHARRLVVRVGSRILFVPVEEVDWVDADGNYARLHVGQKSYLMRETMNRLQERLDPQQYLRIHRSTIVNVDRIQEIQPMFKGNYVVILRDGTRLTTTRGYRENLQALIQGAS